MKTFSQYLDGVKKRNGDKLLPVTKEKYVSFLSEYESSFDGLERDWLVNAMNEILKTRNNLLIYSSFKNYLAYKGIVKDSDVARKLLKPQKSATAMSSVRFLQSKILSRQELQRLYNESDDELRLIFSFLYDTACRRSELLGIKFGDITYLDKGVDDSNIYGKVNILGKGHKSRTVYIGALTFDLLQKLRLNQDPPVKVFEFRDKQGVLLKQQDDKLYYVVKTAIARILGREITPHCFRHTCLSHLASAGSDVLGISKYAGHASLSPTLIYIHTSDHVGRLTFKNFARPLIGGED